MDCQYRCQECGFKWQGYRFMPVEGGYMRYTGPGMSVCPECTSQGPIDWVNYENFRQWYLKNVADGGCGGEHPEKEDREGNSG